MNKAILAFLFYLAYIEPVFSSWSNYSCAEVEDFFGLNDLPVVSRYYPSINDMDYYQLVKDSDSGFYIPDVLDQREVVILGDESEGVYYQRFYKKENEVLLMKYDAVVEKELILLGFLKERFKVMASNTNFFEVISKYLGTGRKWDGQCSEDNFIHDLSYIYFSGFCLKWKDIDYIYYSPKYRMIFIFSDDMKYIAGFSEINREVFHFVVGGSMEFKKMFIYSYFEF